MVVLGALVGVLALLAGCGGSDHERPPTTTAANGDKINQADVEFASDMVVHHAQALQLVTLLREHSDSADLTRIGEDLQTRLSPQNETLVGWLGEWGEPIPETPLDHVYGGHADGDSDGLELSGDEMPGLLSTEQVEELEGLKGAAFDELWVELMTEHQEGAVAMAADLLEQGVFAPVRELAQTIAAEHRDAVAELEELS
jgi:uncharacterized protein (DUF305 family)